MKQLTTYLNEAFITKNNIESQRKGNIIDYRKALYDAIGGIDVFENILKNGTITFTFLPESDPDELPKLKDFVKEFDEYKPAFKYGKNNQGMGEEYVDIDLSKMEDVVAKSGKGNVNNVMFDELVRMADWYGIADEIHWDKV